MISKLISAVLYYLILIPLSLLPLPVLYIIATPVYYILYYVVGYRKKVVRENIARSYPQLGEIYRRKIEKGFYQHFADLMVESIKAFTISKASLEKRFTIKHPEVLLNFKEKRSMVLVTGHYN